VIGATGVATFDFFVGSKLTTKKKIDTARSVRIPGRTAPISGRRL
jgi:hypothetical protein